MRVFRRIHALPLAAAALTIGALAANPAAAADASTQQTGTQQTGVSSAAQVPGNVELNPKATAPYDPLNAAEAARAEAWTATNRLGEFVHMARNGQGGSVKEMAEPAFQDVQAAVERAEQAASRTDSAQAKQDLAATRAALERAQGYMDTIRSM